MEPKENREFWALKSQEGTRRVCSEGWMERRQWLSFQRTGNRLSAENLELTTHLMVENSLP